MFIMTCRSSDREMFPLPSWADISQCDPSYHIYPELTLSNMVKASLMSCSSRSVSIWIVLNRIHILHLILDLGSHHEEEIRKLDEASGIFVDHVDEVLELLLRGVLPYQPEDSWV